MTKIIPIRDLRDTSKISNMVKEEAEPIYITKNGYSDMVIMSAELYESKYNSQNIKEKLKHAQDQINSGETMTGDESLENLKDVLEASIALHEALKVKVK